MLTGGNDEEQRKQLTEEWPPSLLIQGGQVFDPEGGCFARLDVLVSGGKVARIAPAIEAPAGAPVRAAAGGKVLRSGYEALYGNILVVDHGNGFRTVYAHLAERLVATGDSVQKGDLIGKVGDTGRTTGPHLHYEVRVNGLPVNPTRFLN